MSYTGKTYQIPCSKGGLSANKNIDLIPPEAMVHPSRNINLIQGGRSKRGGTDNVNSTAITDTPRIYGVYQFRLQNGNSYILTATGDGKIQKNYSTELATGLTINQAVHFVTFNNLCIICTGNDVPQVWDGSAAATTALANVPADWTGASQPKKMIKHGRGVSERLWAIGCASNIFTVYASAQNAGDGTTEPDFSDANVKTFFIETGDGFGLIDAVEFGDRLVLFGKKQSFIIDDSSATVAEWGYVQAQWEGGAGGNRLVLRLSNDIVCMTEDGDIYAVASAESYGDYKLASLTRQSFIDDWIQEYVKLSAMADFHMVFDPVLRAIKIFIVRNGMSYVDTAMVYFIDRGPEEGWIIHDNQSYASGYKASSSAVIRVGAGNYQVYTGGWADGYVWKLEQTDRNDNGNAYYGGFRTARLNFDNARITKRYDRGWLIARPEGDYSLYINWWIDGVVQTQQSVSLVGTGGLLDSFVLDTSLLGGDELIDKPFDLGNIGKRIQLEIFNSTVNQDFYISQILIDHRTLGVKPS